MMTTANKQHHILISTKQNSEPVLRNNRCVWRCPGRHSSVSALRVSHLCRIIDRRTADVRCKLVWSWCLLSQSALLSSSQPIWAIPAACCCRYLLKVCLESVWRGKVQCSTPNHQRTYPTRGIPPADRSTKAQLESKVETKNSPQSSPARHSGV